MTTYLKMLLSLWSVMTDEDMTPSDTNIDDKMSSFLHLHSDFFNNSLGSICTCCYLNVDFFAKIFFV
jgi:hypothetical protein